MTAEVVVASTQIDGSAEAFAEFVHETHHTAFAQVIDGDCIVRCRESFQRHLEWWIDDALDAWAIRTPKPDDA